MYEKFEKDLDDFRLMIKNKKPQLEIDNEYSRLTETYGLDTKLSEQGYKKVKKTLDKYWSGKRLDNQELGVAYILCPKIILYEKVKFRILDMIIELEQECEARWGTINPPINASKIIMQMCEPNPDYIEHSVELIISVWKDVSLKKAIEGMALAEKLVKFT